VKAAWRFNGNAVLTVDKKVICESDSRFFSQGFLVDGKICEVKFANNSAAYNYSTMTIWAPYLFVDGKEIKPG
jgi:hypothetical protein